MPTHYTLSESENLNIMHVLSQAGQQNTNHGISSSIRNNHLIPMVIMCPDLFKITTQINNLWRASIWIGIRPRYVQNNNLRVSIHRKWIKVIFPMSQNLVMTSWEETLNRSDWADKHGDFYRVSAAQTVPWGTKKKIQMSHFPTSLPLFFIKYPPMRVEFYLTSLCNEVLHK